MINRLKVFENIQIITYSLYNKKICEKIFNKKIYYLPINYYNFNNNNFTKNIDICINHRNFTKIQKF